MQYYRLCHVDDILGILPAEMKPVVDEVKGDGSVLV
jgi:hypothetical protein